MQRDLAASRTQYLEAQLAGDRRGALQIIHEALAHGHPVHALQAEVIQAAHEHMASAL